MLAQVATGSAQAYAPTLSIGASVGAVVALATGMAHAPTVNTGSGGVAVPLFAGMRRGMRKGMNQ